MKNACAAQQKSLLCGLFQPHRAFRLRSPDL